MTTKRIERKIRQLAGSTIFSVLFVKRTTGEERRMVCRLNVTKGVTGKGQSYTPSDRGLLTVYDVQARGFRNIDLSSIKSITVRGTEYVFEQEAKRRS